MYAGDDDMVVSSRAEDALLLREHGIGIAPRPRLTTQTIGRQAHGSTQRCR